MLIADVMSIIASYLDLKSYYKAIVARMDFYSVRCERLLRFKWAKKRIRLFKIKSGKCCANECEHSKFSCIILEPLACNVLSTYCSQCTTKYKEFPIKLLIQ